MIRWFAKNDIATNILLFGILAWGLWSAAEEIRAHLGKAWARWQQPSGKPVPDAERAL